MLSSSRVVSIVFNCVSPFQRGSQVLGTRIYEMSFETTGAKARLNLGIRPG